MAKIAILFLLVALVAICSGARLVREAPAAPPTLPPALQPLVDEAKKLFSEENLSKLKAQGEKLQSETAQFGEKAGAVITEWVKNLETILENKQQPK